MSMHPFEEDITKLSIDELSARYTELLKRYNIARRLDMSQDVIYQLDLMLEGIEFEKTRRLEVPDKNENPVVIDTDWKKKDK